MFGAWLASHSTVLHQFLKTVPVIVSETASQAKVTNNIKTAKRFEVLKGGQIIPSNEGYQLQDRRTSFSWKMAFCLICETLIDRITRAPEFNYYYY